MPDKYDYDKRLRLTHRRAEQAKVPAEAVLGRLADAIAALASARNHIPEGRLLRENALNFLILGRIVSNLLDDPTARERLEHLTDQLVTEVRALARQQPAPDDTADFHQSD